MNHKILSTFQKPVLVYALCSCIHTASCCTLPLGIDWQARIRKVNKILTVYLPLHHTFPSHAEAEQSRIRGIRAWRRNACLILSYCLSSTGLRASFASQHSHHGADLRSTVSPDRHIGPIYEDRAFHGPLYRSPSHITHSPLYRSPSGKKSRTLAFLSEEWIYASFWHYDHWQVK